MQNRKRPLRISPGPFKSGGLKPPELNEIVQDNPHRKRLYQFLTEIGELVPIHSKGLNRVLVFHRQCIDEMVRSLERAYPHSTAFTVAEMRKTRGYFKEVLPYRYWNTWTVRA